MSIRSDSWPWAKDAACATAPTGLFFSDDPVKVEKAKAICRRCPGQVGCFDYALTAYPTERGVWGGTTQDERIKIRRARGLRLELRGRPINHGTVSGEKAHRARGEEPCRQCLDARNADQRERRRRARLEEAS